MKKFTIIHKKGTITLQEVEMRYVTSMEDPSVLWSLKEGEYRAWVLKPESVYDKQKDGSLTPPVWCWHAFYSCEATAREAAESALKEDMARGARKAHVEFDEAEYQKRCQEIQVVTL